jgi:hypothetical protein
MSKLLDEGRAAPAQPPLPSPPSSGPRLAPVTPEEARLRAEHDELQARVAARISVDRARRGLRLLFLGFLGVLLTGKLAWDRWGVLPPGVRRETPPGAPLYLYVALTATVVVLVLAIRAFLGARRLAREEDAVFARLLAVRAALGLDR